MSGAAPRPGARPGTPAKLCNASFCHLQLPVAAAAKVFKLCAHLQRLVAVSPAAMFWFLLLLLAAPEMVFGRKCYTQRAAGRMACDNDPVDGAGLTGLDRSPDLELWARKQVANSCCATIFRAFVHGNGSSGSVSRRVEQLPFG